MVNCRKSLEFALSMYTSSRNTGYYGCLPPWMGRCLQRQNSIGRLEQARVLCVVKLPRNDGNIIGNNIISDDSKKQERANTVGQHYINRLCKPQGWAVSNTFTNSHINLGRSGQQWDVHSMRAYCRSQKAYSRLLVA